MRICQEDDCEESCKSIRTSPGEFYHLCAKHYAEYKRQKNRESYQRHKEKRVQEAVRWQTENPGRYKARQVIYRARDEAKEAERQRSKRRYIEDPAANRKRVRRYEHRKRAAEGRYTEEQWQARLDLYGHRCYLCGCDWDVLLRDEKHIDHVIPLSKGGTNWPANLRPACGTCNRGKSAKTLDMSLVV